MTVPGGGWEGTRTTVETGQAKANGDDSTDAELMCQCSIWLELQFRLQCRSLKDY